MTHRHQSARTHSRGILRLAVHGLARGLSSGDADRGWRTSGAVSWTSLPTRGCSLRNQRPPRYVEMSDHLGQSIDQNSELDYFETFGFNEETCTKKMLMEVFKKVNISFTHIDHNQIQELLDGSREI